MKLLPKVCCVVFCFARFRIPKLEKFIRRSFPHRFPPLSSMLAVRGFFQGFLGRELLLGVEGNQSGKGKGQEKPVVKGSQICGKQGKL